MDKCSQSREKDNNFTQRTLTEVDRSLRGPERDAPEARPVAAAASRSGARAKRAESACDKRVSPLPLPPPPLMLGVGRLRS